MYVEDRAEPQHDPSARLRRMAQVRDMACDAPGCPRQARGCELDHEHDYALGGLTALWNLRHRSPRCHHCKHDDWHVEHDHATGASTWLSPTGRAYHRQGFWPAPTALPRGTALPAPRVELPLAPAFLEGDGPDLGLWAQAPKRAGAVQPAVSAGWESEPPLL
jgi:hypothetical protein